jgi:hypothetical protein
MLTVGNEYVSQVGCATVFQVTLLSELVLQPVPAEVRLVLICNLPAATTALLIGEPDMYACHVVPPSILDS